jgi:hypothetical protein
MRGQGLLLGPHQSKSPKSAVVLQPKYSLATAAAAPPRSARAPFTSPSSAPTSSCTPRTPEPSPAARAARAARAAWAAAGLRDLPRESVRWGPDRHTRHV